MENGILVGLGLIVAVVLLIGIAVAIINLKDVNWNQRLSSRAEHKLIQPPSIQSKRTASNKKIEFGEPTDGLKYPPSAYVEIKSTSSQKEHCPLCRQPLSKRESITCPNCSNQYHVDCFKENKNICQNCKWVQP